MAEQDKGSSQVGKKCVRIELVGELYCKRIELKIEEVLIELASVWQPRKKASVNTHIHTHRGNDVKQHSTPRNTPQHHTTPHSTQQSTERHSTPWQKKALTYLKEYVWRDNIQARSDSVHAFVLEQFLRALLQSSFDGYSYVLVAH